MKQQNIVIFASGEGTNAAKCMHYFKNDPELNVVAVVTNNPKSGVKKHADQFNVQLLFFNNEGIDQGTDLLIELKKHRTDYIILAGFLRKIPPLIIQSFNERIINIHPSLLPKYGGKGMYGDHVHRAVIANNESESGITIHLVDEVFDNGRKLAQFFTPLSRTDDIVSLKAKIQKLEHSYFAPVIKAYIKRKLE